MADRLPQLEWYVLNSYKHRPSPDAFNKYPYSASAHIKPYNIFNNVNVYDATIKLCKQFKTKHMSLEDFIEELRKIIQWQEWSRCEYEIKAGDLFDSESELEKIDCYMQALPNIKLIAKYVLNQYYPRLNLK